MEVLEFVNKGNIVPKISIPNPTWEEGRVYVSKRVNNGWREQRFTSKEYPEIFKGTYIHDEYDQENGKLHPAYITVITKSNWIVSGKQGWLDVKELDYIPRKLLSQEGIANIRSARIEDFVGMEMPEGKFWLASQSFITDREGTHFYIPYAENGKIKNADIYHIDNSNRIYGSDASAGILAIVVLETVIKDVEITEKTRTLWDF